MALAANHSPETAKPQKISAPVTGPGKFSKSIGPTPLICEPKPTHKSEQPTAASKPSVDQRLGPYTGKCDGGSAALLSGSFGLAFFFVVGFNGLT